MHFFDYSVVVINNNHSVTGSDVDFILTVVQADSCPARRNLQITQWAPGNKDLNIDEAFDCLMHAHVRVTNRDDH